MTIWTERENIYTARDAPDAGGTVNLVVTDINGVPLDQFESFTLRLEVTSGATGASPTMDIHAQRAIEDAAVVGDDTAWDALYSFPQVTTDTPDYVVDLPLTYFDADGSLANASRARVLTQTADTLVFGRVGEALRISEVMAGTITNGATYTLGITGYRPPWRPSPV